MENFDPTRTTDYTVDELVDHVSGNRGDAAAIIEAEYARTDREPRATLVERLERLRAAQSGSTVSDVGVSPEAQSAQHTSNPTATGADLSPDPAGDSLGGAPPVAENNLAGVPSGATATLTGDGTPRTADAESVEAHNLTAAEVESRDPMSDENRGSRPVSGWADQPGAAPTE